MVGSILGSIWGQESNEPNESNHVISQRFLAHVASRFKRRACCPSGTGEIPAMRLGTRRWLKKTGFCLGKNLWDSATQIYPICGGLSWLIMDEWWDYHGLMMGIPIDHIFFPCSSPRRHEMGMGMMMMMMMMLMMRMATRLDVLCIKRPATSITLTENATMMLIHFPEDLGSASMFCQAVHLTRCQWCLGWPNAFHS